VAGVRPQLVLLGAPGGGGAARRRHQRTEPLSPAGDEAASREIAIVLSLGASRACRRATFVVEGVVLGLASSIVALPAAAAALSDEVRVHRARDPALHEVSLTVRTIALVIGSGALLGAIVGLVGLGRTGTDGIFDRLRAPGSTSSRAWRRAQNGLVAFQVGVALVLLIAAGLLGRSFRNLQNEQINFEPADAMAFQLSLPWNGYTTYAANASFHAGVADRLAAIPGVVSVGVAMRLPLANDGAPDLDMQLEAGDGGRPPVASASNMASGEYFRTMGIPLRAGRSFLPGDLRGTPAVVVSERLASTMFGTVNVVGRYVRRPARGNDPPRAFRIIGVAGDVHWGRIEDGHVPMVYFPLLRDGDGLPADSTAVPGKPREVHYVVRGTALPSAPEIHAIVTALDRRVPPTGIRTLGTLVDSATARVRLTMLLIAIAGGAALLLGVIGIYTVVAYAVSSRMREFGIRLALGAPPARIARIVMVDGLKLVALGTTAGLAAAVGTTRFLRAVLYEVEPTSPAEFGAATALLLVVTVWATLLPARRAARTPPQVVLRGE
jgi:predicted permease